MRAGGGHARADSTVKMITHGAALLGGGPQGQRVVLLGCRYLHLLGDSPQRDRDAPSHRIHRSSRLPTNFPKFPQPPRHCLTRPATCPQRVHCEDDPLDPVYQRGSEDSALCSGILALEAGTSLLLYPDGPEGAALPVECCLTRVTCYSFEATAGTQAPATLA